MKSFIKNLKELLKYPSAIAGLSMIALLILLSILALNMYPYPEAIKLWRGAGEDWYTSPKFAQPTWTNLFRLNKLSETIDVNSTDDPAYKTVNVKSDGSSVIKMSLPFTFNADSYLNDLAVYFNSTFKEKKPFVAISLKTPDGRTIKLKNMAIGVNEAYRISQDKALIQRLGGVQPEIALFQDPNSTPPIPLKGDYSLEIEGVAFEPESDINAQFIAYGEVSGIAGTDHMRRNLLIPLLWGTPVALLFGLLAAVGTTIMSMSIAAVSTWFGGWVDNVTQRIVEINMILPFLPILIMVGTFYSRSIGTILGTVIILGIFGQSIKTFRAMFLQTKESPYIEAARAYGASDTRIIFQYMMPRVIPVLIPQFILLIPSYVFLEASLAILGLGDPILPTWGKVIDDAYSNGALYNGWYYWVLEPAFLLMFTGLAFAMVGFALDRIFNPRLRGQ
jgi:peptide/nickel transport system permease protein